MLLEVTMNCLFFSVASLPNNDFPYRLDERITIKIYGNLTEKKIGSRGVNIKVSSRSGQKNANMCCTLTQTGCQMRRIEFFKYTF